MHIAVPFLKLDGDTIAKSNKSPEIYWDTLAGNDNTYKIQRVRSGDGDNFARRLQITHSAQRFPSYRQGDFTRPRSAPFADGGASDESDVSI